MKRALIYFNFVLTSIMLVMGFAGASTLPQLISAILFFPLGLYFTLLVLPRRRRAITLPLPTTETTINTALLNFSRSVLAPSTENRHLHAASGQAEPEPILEIINAADGNQALTHPVDADFDADRRRFLKLIGSTSITIFMLSIFTKKAQASFFGSIPGPGTVALKDPTTGLPIEPAQRTPTDGFRISQVDDSVPAYYGFVDKTGAWFIMREDSSGNYRYSRGSTNFSLSWTTRAVLAYDYFDVVF